MRKTFLILAGCAGFLLFLTDSLVAGPQTQKFSNALAYLDRIGQESGSIMPATWEYVRMAAHNNNARSIESKRKGLVNIISKAIQKIGLLPDYEGDTSLRNAMLTNLRIQNIILNEDYAKIVDMEDVAEQSYDMMEAYLLAKKRATDKLNLAQETYQEYEKKYAATHEIHLIMSSNEMSLKIDAANKVYDYFNKIYLIFFKSYKQEAYLVASLDTHDVNKIEQNRVALLKDALEGSNNLAKLQAFENDMLPKVACANLLAFYHDEADKSIPFFTDFLVKKEAFTKIQKSFEMKPQNDRTQDDVDQFNAKVKEINDGVKEYNRINNDINQKRADLIQTWNQITQRFIDTHVPK